MQLWWEDYHNAEAKYASMIYAVCEGFILR